MTTPTTDISVHHCGTLRCSSFYPENSNGLELSARSVAGATSLNLYGLPIEKALALAMLFADAETRVYFKFGKSAKLLEHMADPDRVGPLAGFPAPSAAIEGAK